MHGQGSLKGVALLTNCGKMTWLAKLDKPNKPKFFSVNKYGYNQAKI
jgi:hypothetical protein